MNGTRNGTLTLNQAVHGMLATHPHPGEFLNAGIAQCVEACLICAVTCTACADACLAEDMVAELRECIRTNLDCADICQATGYGLVRQTHVDWRLLYHQLEACQAVCRKCASICEQHAKMHEHCRVCAEACRQCEQACDKMRAALPA